MLHLEECSDNFKLLYKTVESLDRELKTSTKHTEELTSKVERLIAQNEQLTKEKSDLVDQLKFASSTIDNLTEEVRNVKEEKAILLIEMEKLAEKCQRLKISNDNDNDGDDGDDDDADTDDDDGSLIRCKKIPIKEAAKPGDWDPMKEVLQQFGYEGSGNVIRVKKATFKKIKKLVRNDVKFLEIKPAASDDNELGNIICRTAEAMRSDVNRLKKKGVL